MPIRPLILTALLALPLSLTGPARAVPLDIAGFGDSITCDTCNDGSYMSLLANYLPEAPITQDYGVSSDLTSGVLARLNTWLGGGGTADYVIILAGTVDTFQALGGFNGQDYDEVETVGNIQSMLNAVLGAGLTPILAAPPVVQPPCGSSVDPTCAEIDTSLSSLSGALATLAGSLGVTFVDLYDAFASHPDIGEVPGSTDSLLRADGLHPKYATGDDVIAQEIAAAIIPEPSSALLLGCGLVLLAARRRDAARV